jgi:hypothetical protein
VVGHGGDDVGHSLTGFREKLSIMSQAKVIKGLFGGLETGTKALRLT